MTGASMPTNADQHDNGGHDHGHQHDDQAQLPFWEAEEDTAWPDWAADAIEEAAGAAIASTSLTTAANRMAPDMIAVETIDANGDTMFWLTVQDLPQGGGWRPDFAPHEQTGPLPREWKRAVGITCAATAKTTGQPCSRFVARPGDRCHVHGGPAA